VLRPRRSILEERMMAFIAFLRRMTGFAIVCGFWDGR
jgi:hypothetical protein